MIPIKSTVSGTVLDVLVKLGDRVGADQDVVIIESMKMEIPVAAERAGVVREICTEPGLEVREGAILIVLE